MMMHNSEVVHDKMHWMCCWKPMAGKILWALSFLSLVGGLLAYWQGGQFWGVMVATWYWNALVGGVLSLGIRGRYGWCGCGMCTGMKKEGL